MASRRLFTRKQGLTSSTTRRRKSAGLNELSDGLLGASSREQQLFEAAEAILYLCRVQHCRLKLLEEGTLRRCVPNDTERALTIMLSEAVKRNDLVECKSLREEPRTNRTGQSTFQQLPPSS